LPTTAVFVGSVAAQSVTFEDDSGSEYVLYVKNLSDQDETASSYDISYCSILGDKYNNIPEQLTADSSFVESKVYQSRNFISF
jgi:hypothetical protein